MYALYPASVHVFRIQPVFDEPYRLQQDEEIFFSSLHVDSASGKITLHSSCREPDGRDGTGRSNTGGRLHNTVNTDGGVRVAEHSTPLPVCKSLELFKLSGQIQLDGADSLRPVVIVI